MLSALVDPVAAQKQGALFSNVNPLPVTLVDIDDDSWRAWGRPAITPRDKLAGILARLGQSKPIAVVLDVDVTHSATPAEAAAFIAAAAPLRRQGAPVLIPREIFDESGSKRILASPLDGAPGFHWITTRFLTTDYAVSDVVLTDYVCSGAPMALPSAALLVLTLVAKKADGVRDMDAQLADKAKARCADAAKTKGTAKFDDSAPMTFAFRDLADGFSKTSTGQDGHTTPALSRWPAYAVLTMPIASTAFDGRVVIVGASHGDDDDIHLTSYGAMRGMLLLANSIALASDNLGKSALSVFAKWFIVGVAIIAAMACFAFLQFPIFSLAALIIGVIAYGWTSHLGRQSDAVEVAALTIRFVISCVGLELLVTPIWNWIRVGKDPWLLLFRKTPSCSKALRCFKRKPKWNRPGGGGTRPSP